MAYERQNDGNQIYNYNPNVLNSREKIDHYMKNYNESMMMLDYLEAESVIKKNTGTMISGSRRSIRNIVKKRIAMA